MQTLWLILLEKYVVLLKKRAFKTVKPFTTSFFNGHFSLYINYNNLFCNSNKNFLAQ